MILTVTLNPSVDISYPLETLKIDTVNRVKDVSKTAGGKGLNVTRVLYESGDKVTATGFLGGKIGEFIESELEQSPVSPAFYKISGNTTNCIAILHEGNQTELLEQGPTISHEEAEGFLDHYSNLIKQSEVVTISGSLPSGSTFFASSVFIKLSRFLVLSFSYTSSQFFFFSILNLLSYFYIFHNLSFII